MGRLTRHYLRTIVQLALVLAWLVPGPAGAATSAQAAEPQPLTAEVILTGLQTVWELAWGADGRLYLTERPGRIRAWDGERLVTLATLPVLERGESGLMGMALDPAFPRTPYVYVCYTYNDKGPWNRVERLRLENNRLVRDQILLDGMRGASIHDGCRLGFAPDGTLLVTMGDAANASLSQQRDSLNGKVLRIHRDGTVPDDNPFPGSPVYTYGHRNPQGLAVRPGTGEVYISEHGQETDDEINRLVAGRNYGWPLVRGTRQVQGYTPALWSWTPTIAPAGIAFTDRNTLYMATLKESRVHRLTLDEEGRVIRDEVVLSGYGRLRALTLGPDGCLYVGTSNRDGRGDVRPGDDKVLRVCLPKGQG